MSMTRTLRQFALQGVAALALACSHVPDSAVSQASASLPGNAWSTAEQMVVVTTADWNANDGQMQAFARTGEGWQAVGRSTPVTIGRAGSAWGIGLHPAQSGSPKREGDGRAPAGIFRIGTAFGYAPGVDTALPYAAMTESHYCIDVNGSPLYNQIVDSRKTGAASIVGSTEPMRRDIHADGDQRYKLGFVIEHNPEGVDGAGSCIFAHLWKAPGEATAGCTAMDERAMKGLYAWLRPEPQPVFVLMPEAEYLRFQEAWQLPKLALD